MDKSELRVLTDLVYELRQDIAKLRERVAVLESRPIQQHPPITYPNPIGPTPFWPNTITFGDGRAAGQ